MKEKISIFIFGLVISLVGYLFIANILHIIYLNKYDTFNFNDVTIKEIRKNINELESKIEKISKLDNNVFTEDELKLIKNSFDESIKSINSSKILSYNGIEKIYLKDLLNIDLSTHLSVIYNINMLEILAKYDNSIDYYIEVYKYDFISSAYSNDFGFQEVLQSYKYNTYDFFYVKNFEPVNVRILSRVYDLSYYVIKQNYFANLVLEIGGANNE